MLPNARLLARAFHRVPAGTTGTATAGTRCLSTTSTTLAWKGTPPDEHITDEKDTNNVYIDASKGGKAERASGEGSAVASEKDKDQKNKKALDDHPEAPGVVIGMNDERGGVSTLQVVSPCR